MEGEAERNRGEEQKKKKKKFLLEGGCVCRRDAKKASSDSTGLQCERNC